MKKIVIEEYAMRGVQCDVMKALTLLTQAYIRCHPKTGISSQVHTL